MYNKQHLIAILWYLWIGFVGGSISHGFFSWTRSIVMATLGIIMFVVSEILKSDQKDITQLIVWGLVYSVAVGMVSWWLQHLMDSPERSLWIVPLGWIVSTAIFPYKEWLGFLYHIKSLCVGLAISGILFVILWVAYVNGVGNTSLHVNGNTAASDHH